MRWIMVLILVSLANHSIAADCDCTIVPFKPDPPCFDICTAKHLAVATASELETIAGIDPNISRLIAGIPENQRPTTLEGYRQFLSERQFQELKNVLSRLTGKAFEEIRQKAAERGRNIN
jgi:hypothetical protein